MDTMPHWKIVLIQVLGELAFGLVALVLYVFLVLPKYGDGALPGIVPLMAPDVNPLLAALSGILVLAFAVGLMLLLLRVFGRERIITEEIATLAKQFSAIDLALIYVAAAVGEEFLFRVVCIDLCGLVIASILFTAIHVAYWKHPLLLVDVFVLALLLGLLYVYTQSFLLCAVVHFVYNMTVTIYTKRVLAQ